MATLKHGRCVIVTGSRNWVDTDALANELRNRFIEDDAFANLLLIHGGARGADTIAGAWARERGISVVECPAQWERFGKSAGRIRNVEMAKLGDTLRNVGWDVVGVAAPLDGPGTVHCMAVLADYNIPLHVVRVS